MLAQNPGMFVEPQHIKMKPKVGRASLTLGTGAIGAGLTGGVQGNRGNATIRRTRCADLVPVAGYAPHNRAPIPAKMKVAS